ncbi:hypothetical protein BT69DRAFT_131189 [Atractiella rhizophila]|nr:hypothetical protein BT69DRAFT_131189 [Atractiella rhizophila]
MGHGGIFFPDARTLLTCSLVCRDFLHFSRAVYFERDIFFEQFDARDEISLKKLKQLLKSPHQTLHHYLKQVHVMDSVTDVPGGGYDIFALTNELAIKKLALSNTSVNFDQNVMQGFGTLTFFKTEHMRWRFDDFADFAGCHPGLEKLHIKTCNFYRPREGTLEEKVSMNTRRFSSQLRYLYLGQTSADIVLNGLLPLCKLVKLRHVKLWDLFVRPQDRERNTTALQAFFDRNGESISVIEVRNPFTRGDLQVCEWTSVLYSYIPKTSAKRVTFEFHNMEKSLLKDQVLDDWQMGNLEHLRLECYKWTTESFEILKKNLTKERFPALRLIILKESARPGWQQETEIARDMLKRYFEKLEMPLIFINFWLDGKLY